MFGGRHLEFLLSVAFKSVTNSSIEMAELVNGGLVGDYLINLT